MTIAFPNADRDAEVSVFDMHGGLVKDLGRAKTDRVEWKTDGLGKGLYLIKVNTRKESLSRKVSLLK